jgi:curved DNA-binding protein CbpA
LTHYETLKTENSASSDEIKRAYYKLVRQFPPERFPDEFRTLREAYATLSNDKLREKYDLILEKHTEMTGELPDEAVKQIENVKLEIQHTHTGKAVKIAEILYKEYPDNAAVISLLAQAYSARGWKNKVLQLISSPAYYSTLKTSEDWDDYILALEEADVSQTEIFVKIMYGIFELSKNGKNNIDIFAWAYYYSFTFDKKDWADFTLPEEFDSLDKLLNHILKLSKLGLKTNEINSLVSHLLMPIIEYKKPAEISDDDMKRLKIALEIIRNASDARALKKSQFGDIIEGIEYIIESRLSEERIEPVRSGVKTGRNDPCPCGSGKKYKKCCGQ